MEDADEPGGDQGREARKGGGAGGGGAGGELVRARHASSFKLRFAAVREPGRSYVSPVRPRGLPAPITDKFYSRAASADGNAEEAAAAGERCVRELFARGPRERLDAPALSSHEYGWWWEHSAPPADRRLQHHIRDSCWLRARLRVLAADRAPPPAPPAPR